MCAGRAVGQELLLYHGDAPQLLLPKNGCWGGERIEDPRYAPWAQGNGAGSGAGNAPRQTAPNARSLARAYHGGSSEPPTNLRDCRAEAAGSASHTAPASTLPPLLPITRGPERASLCSPPPLPTAACCRIQSFATPPLKARPAHPPPRPFATLAPLAPCRAELALALLTNLFCRGLPLPHWGCPVNWAAHCEMKNSSPQVIYRRKRKRKPRRQKRTVAGLWQSTRPLEEG